METDYIDRMIIISGCFYIGTHTKWNLIRVQYAADNLNRDTIKRCIRRSSGRYKIIKGKKCLHFVAHLRTILSFIVKMNGTRYSELNLYLTED